MILAASIARIVVIEAGRRNVGRYPLTGIWSATKGVRREMTAAKDSDPGDECKCEKCKCKKELDKPKEKK